MGLILDITLTLIMIWSFLCFVTFWINVTKEDGKSLREKHKNIKI